MYRVARKTLHSYDEVRHRKIPAARGAHGHRGRRVSRVPTPGGRAASGLGLQGLRSETHAPLSPLARLRRLASLERGDLTVIVIYAVAIGLVSLVVPVAAQALVNTVAFTALLQPVLVLAALVVVGLLAAGLLRTLQYHVIETLHQRFFVRACHESVTRLVRADLRGFDEHGAPELMNRFFDVAIAQKAASTLLMDGLAVALQAAVSLLLLAFYHPALLAFDVVLIASIAFILFGLGRSGTATAIKESKTKYRTAAWLQEMARAARAFKAEGASDLAFQRADSLAREYVEARRKHFAVVLRQVIASHLLQALATAGLLGLGGALVIKGQLTLGQLVAAELIVTGVLAGVAKFGKYLESYYDLLASLDKIGTIVDLPSERMNGGVRTRPGGPLQLRLKDVSFSYDGRSQVLSNLSLELAPGRRHAVLGPDASGKSTLVDLVYGVRLPSRGQLTLDGVDVRALALADLRKDVVLVAQAELFNASVSDNVRLGRADVDATAITRALDTVGLSEDIANLPEGAETCLGHGGGRLTSRQAARLAIARGLVAQPRLLLIDGTLDTLGADSAREVLSAIAASAPPLSLLVLTSNADVAAEVGSISRLDRGPLLDRAPKAQAVS